MLSFPAQGAIYVVVGVTDMRRGFDTLAAIVSEELRRDPLSGEVFIFANKKRSRLKILLFDGSGLVVCAKRLESGTFAWPEADAKYVELTAEELTLLLGGIDLQAAKRRRWFRRDIQLSPERKKEIETYSPLANTS